MDTKELIAQAKIRFNHQQSRLALQSKYQSQLTLAYNGGFWQVSTELISLLSSLKKTEFILVDSYDKPIKVNCDEMLKLVKEKYTQVMESWLEEYTELSKLR